MKALGPAPERMTTRVEGEVERWEKRGGNSAHILLRDRLARRMDARENVSYASVKALSFSGRLIST